MLLSGPLRTKGPTAVHAARCKPSADGFARNCPFPSQYPMNGLCGGRALGPSSGCHQSVTSALELPWDQLRFLLRLHWAQLLILPWPSWFLPSFPRSQEHSLIIFLHLHFVSDSASQEIWPVTWYFEFTRWGKHTDILTLQFFPLNISGKH